MQVSSNPDVRMRPMTPSLSRFRAALLTGWVALSAAGIVYARLKSMPTWAAVPVLAAFLIEYPFYLVPAFPELRERLRGKVLPPFLVVSILLPYLACSLGTGQFHWISIMRLTALALMLGLWYVVLPAAPVVDAAFLIILAVVILTRYFDAIYPVPLPALKVAYLGQVALIHISELVLLVQRRVPETGFGFIPNRKEWRIGALHYLGFLPVAAVLALSLKAVRFAPPAPLRAAGTFLAFFLVVALFEEFIFRGVLQQWMEAWTRSRAAALCLTSGIFGLVHFWFRNFPFPNWRWALIAAALGWFCGHARNQAGSIRASVITHALVVTTWRAFFV